MTLLLSGLGLGLSTGCSPSPSPSNPAPLARKRPAARRPASRAKPATTAVTTLARLNGICAKSRRNASCDLLERSWANPSGTLRGPVFDKIKQAKATLTKLGKVLSWDDRAEQYRFVSARPPRSLRVVKRADIRARSGSLSVVYGVYRAIPMPIKRRLPTTTTATPNTYGSVTLDDGTLVYLGVYNTPPATRPATERRRYHKKRVLVWGYVHHRPPWGKQAPSAPCITGPLRIFNAQPTP